MDVANRLAKPYDLAIWKQGKVHRDCRVVFERAYYSVPFRLVGQQAWVRGNTQTVQAYTSDYHLVATHTHAQTPGQRLTNLDHLPTYKVSGITLPRDSCRLRADEIGPATRQVVDLLLNHRPDMMLLASGTSAAASCLLPTALLKSGPTCSVRPCWLQPGWTGSPTMHTS